MDISISDVLSLSNPNLIDIRDRYKYLQGTILDSRNISYSDLIIAPDNFLSKNVEYYIFCDYGNKSKRVVSILRDRGYLVYNIIGGYNSYVMEK